MSACFTAFTVFPFLMCLTRQNSFCPKLSNSHTCDFEALPECRTFDTLTYHAASVTRNLICYIYF